MGIKYRVYLDHNIHSHRIYICAKCRTHLTTHHLLISKDFQGVHGQAYLFDEVVNIEVSKSIEERPMRTGDHCISFIYCKGCNEEIGWVYIKAYEQDQKYKEGKYILEKTRVRLLNKS